MTRQSAKLPLPRQKMLKRGIKRAISLVELTITMGLIGLLTSFLGAYGLHYWNTYLLDQSARALQEYIKKVEVIGVLTQANLRIQFTTDSKGAVCVSVEGPLPNMRGKAFGHLELPGVTQVEPSSCFWWIYGSPVRDCPITLLSKGRKRTVVWRSQIMCDYQEAL